MNFKRWIAIGSTIIHAHSFIVRNKIVLHSPGRDCIRSVLLSTSRNDHSLKCLEGPASVVDRHDSADTHIYECETPEDIEDLGSKLAQVLYEGDVILLKGIHI